MEAYQTCEQVNDALKKQLELLSKCAESNKDSLDILVQTTKAIINIGEYIMSTICPR